MKRLRQKIINDFIDTLNEREQEYMLKKLKVKIEEREFGKDFDFTINGKKYYIA